MSDRWVMLARHNLGEVSTTQYVAWLLRQGDPEWELVMVYGQDLVNEARAIAEIPG